jgi:NADPH:quinone reductase-like Zn-dependent oxidoreductase
LARPAASAAAACSSRSSAGCEVIACSSSASKLERLKALGADHLLDYSQHKLTDWVFEKFGKPHRRKFTQGVDVVVNFTAATPGCRRCAYCTGRASS